MLAHIRKALTKPPAQAGGGAMYLLRVSRPGDVVEI